MKKKNYWPENDTDFILSNNLRTRIWRQNEHFLFFGSPLSSFLFFSHSSFFLQVQELNTFFENCCTIDRDLQNNSSVFCAYNCVSFQIVIIFLHNTFVLLHLTKSTEFSHIVHSTIAVGHGNWMKLNKIDEMQPVDHRLAVGFTMLLCCVSGSDFSHCVMIIILSSFICDCILCIQGTVVYKAAIGQCVSHAQ